MSSKIEVQRICQHCGKIFTAKTTVTQYCGDTCAKKAYKVRIKNAKIQQSNEETNKIIQKPLLEIQNKEFLTAKEGALLLNCSLRSLYLYLKNGQIPSVNLGQRMLRIKRSDIDQMFKKIN